MGVVIGDCKPLIEKETKSISSIKTTVVSGVPIKFKGYGSMEF